MPKVGQSFWGFSFLDNNFYGNIHRAQCHVFEMEKRTHIWLQKSLYGYI